MPWLLKDKPTLEEKLLFIHVPRCGGTSLMHHFDVPVKVRKGRSCWGRFGMRLFFHRYKLLESANFPICTYGNAMAIVLLILSLICSSTQFEERHLLWGFSIFLAVAAFTFFFFLSFVFTAPTIGRVVLVRRAYLILVDWILCRFMESIEWCTGTNRTGYMMHLTAPKLLGYGYVSAEEMEKCCTMAIVRNPYSRMVSMYSYNKFGRCESFKHFVKAWYNNSFKAYRERGEMDEWYTPCHAIPQFEYTHYQGKQLVQAVVKQEELKLLKTKEGLPKAVEQDCTVADLPDPVRDALLGMPHTNSRKTSKKWFEYFDQETLDLTYEMYQHDFEVFHYSPALTQRTDLQPPKLYVEQQKQLKDEEAAAGRARRLEGMLRDSSKSSSKEQALRSSLMRKSGSQTTQPGKPFHSSMIGPGSELLDLGALLEDQQSEEKDVPVLEEAVPPVATTTINGDVPPAVTTTSNGEGPSTTANGEGPATTNGEGAATTTNGEGTEVEVTPTITNGEGPATTNGEGTEVEVTPKPSEP